MKKSPPRDRRVFFRNGDSRLFVFKLMKMPTLALIAVVLSAMTTQSEERESFAVMTAVLDSLYHSDGDRASVVVVGDSLFWREGGVAYGGRLLLPYKSSIDQATIADFEAKTRRTTTFPPAFRYRRLVLHKVGEWNKFDERGREIAKATSKREPVNDPFWIAFAEKYPRAWGITFLSRVGFNPQKTEALIHFRHQCGSNCGSGEAIYLRKVRGRWRIAERIAGLSWEGPGVGSLRYLGPGVHRLPIWRKQQDSTRRAIADSIRRDRAPRRLRGTIRSEQTGLPIPYAQLFIHTARFPAESLTRVVADSRGRYTVRNPLMGGTMLEVQCPGMNRRDGATLAAPGTYVFPAMDTTIDIRVPDIEPCWASRRVRSLISGELASTDYRESPYPSPTDAAVYEAVVRDLQVGDSAVVSSETRPWCRIFHQCPIVHVAHLERLGLLQPSTFENFKSVASDSVRLNPVVMEDIGIPLLSVGERVYLMQEAKRGAFFNDAVEHRGFWTGIRTSHRGARRILSFTRPGYSATKDQAIVSYHLQMPEDEVDETILLNKKDEEWRIVRRRLESGAISGELVNGKCVPAMPGERPTPEQLANIEGVFDFSLISSATDNRVTTRRVSVKKGDVRFDTHSQAGEIGFSSSLLIRGVFQEHLFGEWSEQHGNMIPIGRDGKAIPEPAGYFCATRIEQ